MGWFDNFWKRDSTPQDPVPEPTPIVDDVLLQALLNGETITRDKVMTLPSVNGAVDFIPIQLPQCLSSYTNTRMARLRKF